MRSSWISDVVLRHVYNNTQMVQVLKIILEDSCPKNNIKGMAFIGSEQQILGTWTRWDSHAWNTSPGHLQSALHDLNRSQTELLLRNLN